MPMSTTIKLSRKKQMSRCALALKKEITILMLELGPALFCPTLEMTYLVYVFYAWAKSPPTNVLSEITLIILIGGFLVHSSL